MQTVTPPKQRPLDERKIRGVGSDFCSRCLLLAVYNKRGDQVHTGVPSRRSFFDPQQITDASQKQTHNTHLLWARPELLLSLLSAATAEQSMEICSTHAHSSKQQSS